MRGQDQRREKILGTGPQTRFVCVWQGRLISEIRDGSVTEYLFLEQQPIVVVTGGFFGTDGDKDSDGIADSEDNCSCMQIRIRWIPMATVTVKGAKPF